jgi:alanyl-tRNA synthetase
MTERLYYADSYVREFDALVLRMEPRGAQRALWLDRSAFYPTTGGQPFDTGTLGGCTVVDVTEDESGDLVHLIDGLSAPGVGQHVRGVVDWDRRFDHMQQHTGQHVLSAAFVQVHAAKTISFHLGTTASTIDLDRDLTPDALVGAEAEANRIVWEDRPVSVRYASAAEAAALPLRKESTRTGTLRLIDVEGFDLSACGGTHVRRTGSIGLIAISGWERFKGGLRIEFVCGGRSASRFHRLRDLVSASSRLLSALPDGIPTSIERLLEEARTQKRTIGALQSALSQSQAASLAAAAEVHPFGRLVLQSIEGDAAALKDLALALVGRPGVAAVIVSTVAPCLVVVARSADLHLSSRDLVASLMQKFGGRGGGRPELAQGGGLAAPPEAILAEARRLLS